MGTGDQRNRLDRPTAGRGGFSVALLGGWWWLAWLVLALGAGTAVAETASGRVVEVTEEGGATVVLLSVGRVDGLAEDAPVTLLRQAAPIIHPLTGEVLGVPQEPVGLVQLDRVEERQARGHLVKAYTAPRIGDLAEYQRRLPVAAPAVAAVQPVPVPQTPAPDRPDRVDRVIERVDGLERTLRDYRADQQSAARSGDLSQEVWDELTSMKSYLRTLDRRLAGLETRQGEDRDRLNTVVRGEFPAGEAKELTIRYSPDTEVQLRVAGRTLVIEVERDSLRLVEAPLAAAAASPLPEPAPASAPVDVAPVPSAPDSGAEQFPAETPGIPDEPAASVMPPPAPLASEESGLDLSALNSPYVQAGSLGLIAALAGVLFYLMRRRENALASEFEELERGYLDDEEEDER